MELLMGMLVCFIIVIAVALIIQVLFLLTLYRTQQAVHERNRELSPGLVWLTLIPLFGMIWAPIMVPKLSNSLRREFEDRGWRVDGEGFARTTGMLWAWGGIANAVLSIIQNVAQLADMGAIALVLSLLSLPVGLGVLVCWIIYWVQMYQYGKRLREGERGYQAGSLEEDYDDDYRRSRRSRSEDEDDERPTRRRDDEYGDEEGDRPRRRDGD
jgi:hypothetical protein